MIQRPAESSESTDMAALGRASPVDRYAPDPMQKADLGS
jgi:hypothetical protein